MQNFSGGRDNWTIVDMVTEQTTTCQSLHKQIFKRGLHNI